MHPLHDPHLLTLLQEPAVLIGQLEKLQSPLSPRRCSVCDWSTFERLCIHGSWLHSKKGPGVGRGCTRGGRLSIVDVQRS